MRKYFEPFLHILLWGLFFYFGYHNFAIRIIALKGAEQISHMTSQVQVPAIINVLIIDTSFKLLLFYLSSYKLLPNYFKNRKKRGLILLGLLFIISLAASLSINAILIKYVFQYVLNKPIALFGYFILFHVIIFLLAIGYRLSKDWTQNEKYKREIKEEQLKTELAYLKAQINPHFMFNTLNNLYAEARKHENKTLSNGIAKLSHIMRYMIYDSNVSLVPLEKEVQNLKSFIDLQLLRTAQDDPVDISLDISEFDRSIQVAPLLFLPFVENAFKHGVIAEQQSLVNISLRVESDTLIFKVFNSKFPNHSSLIESTGIGLNNIKRRLSLIYPETHDLLVKEHKESFEICLKLNLKNQYEHKMHSR